MGEIQAATAVVVMLAWQPTPRNAHEFKRRMSRLHVVPPRTALNNIALFAPRSTNPATSNERDCSARLFLLRRQGDMLELIRLAFGLNLHVLSHADELMELAAFEDHRISSRVPLHSSGPSRRRGLADEDETQSGPRQRRARGRDERSDLGTRIEMQVPLASFRRRTARRITQIRLKY